ncbi:hypothetical protein [Actinoplanes awajinensis]|uniref:Uncharacterized protein n=1 Tax=Actinoplanes awajinensis subsp. mycoplanecinus TaxID=135947 RepID=A0A0X3VDS1_9ACTN|nr:hypothetical protein [Actinoplanes awajinensis]KUL41456.1 hypothetical protein ADL15_04170 [Actinoplanes awajinensis subsp. mycoplanecinus]
MGFFFDLPWRYATLPVLLVVAWTALWWASRRARMWFAGLAPAGAIAVVLLGAIQMLSPSDSARSCGTTSCPGGPADLSTRIDTLGSGPGALTMTVGLLTVIVATALMIVTLVVETTLMVRRHEKAERAE